MGNRHKARGGAMSSRDDYSGTGTPKVVKEAKSEKNFNRGGAAMKVAGAKAKSRVKKAGGGGVGCDKNPFSSAHRG